MKKQLRSAISGQPSAVSSQRLVILCFLLLTFYFSLLAGVAHSAGDVAKPAEKKRAELPSREEALKREEERLKALRKELDEKIDEYTKILGKIEESLKALESSKNARLDHMVKAYEAMSPEEAASRLSAMDEQTSVKIIMRMKSKKAGPVMASMDPKKAAGLTESIAKITKKFPTR
jgi:flagellar motility protein MotE (MotC chaperone)